MRKEQLDCFFDTGCLAKKVTMCNPVWRFASRRVPQDGLDFTLRNQSTSVDGWSNFTNASFWPGANSAITSFGHSSRGFRYSEAHFQMFNLWIYGSTYGQQSVLFASTSLEYSNVWTVTVWGIVQAKIPHYFKVVWNSSAEENSLIAKLHSAVVIIFWKS